MKDNISFNSSTPLISVIVPVYNSEAFLTRCVDSIRNQTYKNLEIILVDDGSTDASGPLCDAFQAEDPRIRVIHQANGGLSCARNRGLDLCRGEYIAFVDSDDYIAPDMYQQMLSCLLQESVDISVCQWQYEYANGQQVIDSSKINPSVFGKKSANAFAHLIYAGPYENGLAVSAWNKLCRKDIFTSLRFSGRYAEDDNIIGYILFQNPSIYVMKQQFYVYCQNSDSLTNQGFSEKQILFLNALENRVVLFASDPALLQKTAQLYCNIYIEYYYKAKNRDIEIPDIHRFDKMCRLLLKLHGCNFKFVIRMLLFRISPTMYIRLLNR